MPVASRQVTHPMTLSLVVTVMLLAVIAPNRLSAARTTPLPSWPTTPNTLAELLDHRNENVCTDEPKPSTSTKTPVWVIQTESLNLSKPDSFKEFAKKQYVRMFEELEFSSWKATLMHYDEAKMYNEWSESLERWTPRVLVGLFVFCAAGSLAAWFRQPLETSYKFISAFITSSGLGTFVMSFASSGSTTIFTSLNERSKEQIHAAVGWRRLAILARSKRILLKDPSVTVKQSDEWFTYLVDERKKAGENAAVRRSTYDKFMNAEEVYNDMKKKRDLFDEFIQRAKDEDAKKQS